MDSLEKATVRDIAVRGRLVLERVDFNVPLDDAGSITDDTRIRASLPTIRYLIEQGAAVVLMSHLGRPKGKPDPKYSLKPVAERLSELLGQPVRLAPDCVGPQIDLMVRSLVPGDVLLLENLRFHAEEEANDPAFAQQLAALGDIYVNDAFGTAHRAHASTEGVTHYLPVSAAGLLMEKELSFLGAALEHPRRPLVAISGGAKVSTKLDLLGNLVGKVDRLVIGGGMANTFLFGQSIEIGKSLAEREMADTAREILGKAQAKNCKILLPVDAVVAAEFKPNPPVETIAANAVPKDKMILDVGPKTVDAIVAEMKQCKTLVWNGPLGAFETPPFERATVAVAQEAAALTKSKALLTVAGGGDTVAALAAAGVEEQFSYVSTAGGAFLEWLEGQELPGVAALAASKGK